MTRRTSRLAAALSAAAAFAFVLLAQWALDCWRSGWSGNVDAPAHLVSSLAIRQYALDGLPGATPPLEFAHAFYHRFPKVAIGHWPPLFHSTLAAWLLLAPVKPAFILAFQAILAGLLAALTTLLGSRLLGARRAALAGFAAAVSAPVLTSAILVMADVLVAVWIACGLLAFQRYWRKPGAAPSLAFGFSLAAALLTKPSGAALALVPPLCVLFARRWPLLRLSSFWLLFLPAILLYGPWHIIFRDAAFDGLIIPRRIQSRFLIIPLKNLRLLATSIGWIFLPVALWFAARMRTRRRWTILAGGAVAPYVFFGLIFPVSELRHYTTAAPSLAILAAGGIAALARKWNRRLEPALWAVFVVSLLASARLPRSGFGTPAAVSALLRNPAPQTWLVAGDAAFEGDVIAEAAIRRPSSGLTVYRASKLFIAGNWTGRANRLIIQSPAEGRSLLERCNIETVILGNRGVHPVIAQVVTGDPSRWRPRNSGFHPHAAVVYERIGSPPAQSEPPVIQRP